MADLPPKKRVSLPVVGDGARERTLLERAELGDDGDGTRGPWAWVLLGVMAVFVVLVPLGMVMMAVLRRVYADLDAPPIASLVAASIAAIALSSVAGGWLVGRFGPRMTPMLGAATGTLTGVVLWGLSRMWVGVVVLLLTAPFAALGARVGRKQRRGNGKPGSQIG
ncbi:MAG: hypothetical protein ABI175_01385 [Polyangiales bacterium]